MDFPTTSDHKRYHSLYHYNQMRYGGRVYKASLDVGCSCPNRDGSISRGGCTFCRGGSHYFAGNGSLAAQLEAERERIRQKNPGAKLIAYFQAGTNTYGDISRLEALWAQAADAEDVVGVSIATRCDCLPEPVLDALSALQTQTDLTVELGLQTVHDAAAMRINRGHSFAAFCEGYDALKERGIRVCVHLINGLPGETRDDMLASAQTLAALRPDGVKLHLLHVTDGTELAGQWRSGSYLPMEKQDYMEIVAEQIRHFPPETVMERLTGDGDQRYLLAPMWGRDKRAVLGGIDHQLRVWNAVQGDRFVPCMADAQVSNAQNAK